MLVLAGTIPLLWPEIPPLNDVPGHMGRYAVQLDLAHSPLLQRWYAFQWALIPNLGVDLLVQMFGPMMGMEQAVKMIVLAIPALQIAGILLVAQVAHGRVPATAFFALPLAYGYPFQFGFINFTLSIALAFLAFAGWMRLGQLGMIRTRWLLFVPLSFLVWLTHIYGWAILCILAGADELMRRWPERNRLRALFLTGLSCLSLLTPMVVTALWAADANGHGVTDHFFRVVAKLGWMVMILRDRWLAWDVLGAFLIIGVMLWGMFSKRVERHPGLVLATILLAILFVLLPRQLMGSDFCDMRMPPVLFMVGLVAFSPAITMSARLVSRLAAVGIAFFGLRLVGTTVSFAMFDQTMQEELGALAHLPRNARLVNFAWEACDDKQEWLRSRIRHIGSLALVRRHAYSNDQWQVVGGQLITMHYRQAGRFQSDPSQQFSDDACANEYRTRFATMSHDVPRAAFDYVWVVQPSIAPHMPGWREIWRHGNSRLFVVAPGSTRHRKSLLTQDKRKKSRKSAEPLLSFRPR